MAVWLAEASRVARRLRGVPPVDSGMFASRNTRDGGGDRARDAALAGTDRRRAAASAC